MIWLYRLGLAIDILTLLFILYQYCIVPLFNSFSSTRWNTSLSIFTLVLFSIVCLSFYLGSYQNNLKLATRLLWIPAFPILLYLFLLMALIIGKPDWK